MKKAVVILVPGEIVHQNELYCPSCGGKHLTVFKVCLRKRFGNVDNVMFIEPEMYCDSDNRFFSFLLRPGFPLSAFYWLRDLLHVYSDEKH